MGKSGKDKEAAEEKRVKAQQFYQNVIGRVPTLSDESSTDQVYAAALAVREGMTATLDRFARKKCSCARSKRWWSEDLTKLRKELGTERRWLAGIGRVQEARRNLRRAIRKAKSEAGTGFCRRRKAATSGPWRLTPPRALTRPAKHWWPRMTQ